MLEDALDLAGRRVLRRMVLCAHVFATQGAPEAHVHDRRPAGGMPVDALGHLAQLGEHVKVTDFTERVESRIVEQAQLHALAEAGDPAHQVRHRLAVIALEVDDVDARRGDRLKLDGDRLGRPRLDRRNGARRSVPEDARGRHSAG